MEGRNKKRKKGRKRKSEKKKEEKESKNERKEKGKKGRKEKLKKEEKERMNGETWHLFPFYFQKHCIFITSCLHLLNIVKSRQCLPFYFGKNLHQ